MSGSVTRRRTYQREAPSVDAASSSRSSRPRSPASSASTASGNDTNVAASTAAPVVKVSWMPNHSYNHDPRIPFRRPNAASRPTPATTGGITSGRTTIARTRVLPGKVLRTRTHASGNPRTKEIAAAVVATTSEIRRAVERGLAREDLDDAGPRRPQHQTQEGQRDEGDAQRRQDDEAGRDPPPTVGGGSRTRRGSAARRQGRSRRSSARHRPPGIRSRPRSDRSR